MLPAVQQQYFPLKGGLDLESPAMSIDPGKSFDAMNYVCNPAGGYSRDIGYERFDGRTAPSSATYWILPATVTGSVSVGDTVTGATSAATGKVLQANADELVLGRVSGTFVAEVLNVSGSPEAESTDGATENGATSAALNADYALLAANDRRADIAAVPGSGTVRGVWMYNDVVYAFRNNAGGTAVDMYKSTSGGWSLVSLGTEVQFTAGGGATPAEGATLTQGGVTATIRRIARRSGAWTGSAVGAFVITGVSGGNFAAGAATATGGVTITLSGVQTAIALPAGGRYQFVNYNFSGSSSNWRMYGCNGVGTAFEFDGTYFCPIRTGMTTDTPSHIAAHKNYLWLAFKGSLQFSGIADQYAWTPVLGANEIGAGDDITALLPMTGNTQGAALGVLTKQTTKILYGSSSSDFNLVTISPETGGYAYTAANMAGGLMLSERGLQQIVTTQEFGDFASNTISYLIDSFIVAHRGLASASYVSKERDQYRLFYSDGYGLVATVLGNKVIGLMPIKYVDEVNCCCAGESSAGVEKIYFGSDDGFVYQDGIGTSQDGETLDSWLRLAFNNIGSPMIRKQFRRAVLEASVESYAEISISYELGYSTPDVAQSIVVDREITGGGGYWDQFTWDEFYWDAQSVLNSSIDLTGSEKNISIVFYSNRAQDTPHTLQGVILMFIPRRLER